MSSSDLSCDHTTMAHSSCFFLVMLTNSIRMSVINTIDLLSFIISHLNTIVVDGKKIIAPKLESLIHTYAHWWNFNGQLHYLVDEHTILHGKAKCIFNIYERQRVGSQIANLIRIITRVSSAHSFKSLKLNEFNSYFTANSNELITFCSSMFY